MNVMVICIGNKARGDDGAARRVAELLRERLPQHARLISRPQLDIVMAEDVARADLVLFVDAERRESPRVKVEPLGASTAGTSAHALDPGGLLSLAATVYGAEPEARLVSIAAPSMPHGEGLSEIAKAASEEAAFVVLDLVGPERESSAS